MKFELAILKESFLRQKSLSLTKLFAKHHAIAIFNYSSLRNETTHVICRMIIIIHYSGWKCFKGCQTEKIKKI